MFNIQDYPEATRNEMRSIAQEALSSLGAFGVEHSVDTPAVEQLWRLS